MDSFNSLISTEDLEIEILPDYHNAQNNYRDVTSFQTTGISNPRRIMPPTLSSAGLPLPLPIPPPAYSVANSKAPSIAFDVTRLLNPLGSAIMNPGVQPPMQNYQSMNNNIKSISTIKAPQPNPGHRILPTIAVPVTNYQYGYAHISFSLLSTTEFTAIADNGFIPLNIISTLQRAPGGRFDWNMKRWVFPLSSHDMLQVALSYKSLIVDPLPRTIIATAQLAAGSASASAIASQSSDQILKDRLSPRLLQSLASFQREAVAFVLKNDGRAMICDEMGLGKTREAIAASVAYKHDWPVLVLSPTSAKRHWQAEILSLTSPEVISMSDITIVDSVSHPIASSAKHCQYKYVIISYGMVQRMIKKLVKMNFNVVIADESHYLKNINSLRTKLLLPLMLKSRRVLLLSGTPALSRPMELFTQLHIVDSKAWPDAKAFGKRYCKNRDKKKSSNFHQEFKGASNTKELHVLLTSTVMIRRLKKDVLGQLPKKERRIVKVEVEDPSERAHLRSLLDIVLRTSLIIENSRKKKSKKRFLDDEEEAGDPSQSDLMARTDSQSSTSSTLSSSSEDQTKLEKIKLDNKTYFMELFNKSGYAKLPSFLKHVETFLQNPLSGKLLIFAHHKTVLNAIDQRLKSSSVNFIRIDGTTPSKSRQGFVTTFQTFVACRVALLSITAAGVAITLTAASTVYFAELFWTPGSIFQAEDRAHRIGQIAEVKISYFLADGTIDDLLWPMIKQKLRVLGEVVEGTSNGGIAINADDNTNDDVDEEGREVAMKEIENMNGVLLAEESADDLLLNVDEDDGNAEGEEDNDNDEEDNDNDNYIDNEEDDEVQIIGDANSNTNSNSSAAGDRSINNSTSSSSSSSSSCSSSKGRKDQRGKAGLGLKAVEENENENDVEEGAERADADVDEEDIDPLAMMYIDSFNLKHRSNSNGGTLGGNGHNNSVNSNSNVNVNAAFNSVNSAAFNRDLFAELSKRYKHQHDPNEIIDIDATTTTSTISTSTASSIPIPTPVSTSSSSAPKAAAGTVGTGSAGTVDPNWAQLQLLQNLFAARSNVQHISSSAPAPAPSSFNAHAPARMNAPADKGENMNAWLEPTASSAPTADSTVRYQGFMPNQLHPLLVLSQRTGPLHAVPTAHANANIHTHRHVQIPVQMGRAFPPAPNVPTTVYNGWNDGLGLGLGGAGMTEGTRTQAQAQQMRAQAHTGVIDMTEDDEDEDEEEDIGASRLASVNSNNDSHACVIVIDD